VKLCDPDNIKPQLPRDNLHILPVKDPARFEMDCSNHMNDLGVNYDYQLFIQQKDDVPTTVEKLVCDPAGRIFKGKTNGSNDTTIDQSDFSAYCAIE
ncbi:hypothetical protein PFISCL1PPCAC_4489, partial [Pristionchus fissidentatus]